MTQSSYNIKDVYSVFNEIDDAVGAQNGGNVEYIKPPIIEYCPYNTTMYSNYCNNYFQKASYGVIHFLKTLKDKFDSKYDKLAEYAILLLSYKLNQNSEYSSKKLIDLYTKHIGKDKHYNDKINNSNSMTYKDIMDKKKDLMNMNIKEKSKFNGLFSILFSFYNEIKKTKLDCPKDSNKAIEFAKKFEELNNDSNINGNTSYRTLLSTLSDDYNNLKNKCTDFPPLPMIKTPPSKLLPALSTFSVIPVFLGIAYKYSLFGIDKVFQRQYIRKKLKKLQKKMKINI
ncbi:PIR protein CIR protein [Plasmodium vinckei vinckei]|uniref:PIR protein CIR protein n=1 Tax=Plasmodium vinckei vinckei TaxID=54757 RepID=A0A449BMS6_PLAVN|nr:PIR protein CIR protein [Plasmodium vinckei vinckei]VEV54723.1 PIR protein CIR protein [Plasmodium vinckei vinckei]